MTRSQLLREAELIRRCPCDDPNHEQIATYLEERAAQTPEGGDGAAPGTQVPAVTPTPSACEHGCCLPAVCEFVGDCASHRAAS